MNLFIAFNLSMASFGLVFWLSLTFFLIVALINLVRDYKAGRAVTSVDQAFAYGSALIVLAFIPWANLLMGLLFLVAPFITRHLARRATLVHLDRVLNQRRAEAWAAR